MYKILLTSTILILNFVVFSQNYTPIRPKIIDSSKPDYKGETVKENAVTKTFLVKNEEYYTEFIKALKGKKSYLMSDSALNQKAIELNWYSRVNKEIEKAELELSKIKSNEK